MTLPLNSQSASVDELPRHPVRLPPPCPICGEIEHETTAGVYRISHDYSKHGIAPPPRQRMETEELFGIPNPDFAEVIR